MDTIHNGSLKNPHQEAKTNISIISLIKIDFTVLSARCLVILLLLSSVIVSFVKSETRRHSDEEHCRIRGELMIYAFVSDK